MSRQQFGGDWTYKKLKKVKDYLSAYSKILNGKGFTFAYIDAFAGTGYREMRHEAPTSELLFPDLAKEEPQQFLYGSAQIALQVEPGFDQYIFIERDSEKASQLEEMILAEYHEKMNRITVYNEDANLVLARLCHKDWNKHRAVLFLDPFGMQVDWATIEGIAQTKAIDLWTLFPLGVAVNRMLTRDGDINPGWVSRLDRLFGTRDWFPQFYEKKQDVGLFGKETRTEKTADFDAIGRYYIKRLKSVFPFVAKKPLALMNSKNNPLYLLCFAAGNQKGGPTALKIAQYLLRR